MFSFVMSHNEVFIDKFHITFFILRFACRSSSIAVLIVSTLASRLIQRIIRNVYLRTFSACFATSIIENPLRSKEFHLITLRVSQVSIPQILSVYDNTCRLICFDVETLLLLSENRNYTSFDGAQGITR